MRSFILLLVAALIGGCASYTTPGRGAQMNLFGATPQEQAAGADGGIKAAMEKKPLASFPASIAIVRVQAANYSSYTGRGGGVGQYSVLTTRDIEKPADLQRVNSLSMVRGVAPLNRLVIPTALNTDYELRAAAARMHADILLLYTLDTVFHETDRTTPISVISLGAATTKRLRIISTASAALLDTRSGYVYGLAEASKEHEELQNAWKTEEEVDLIRRNVETNAFSEMIEELETTWKGVLLEHAHPAGAKSADVYRTVPN